ncbi:MAG: hypothetical protein GY805_21320 [Chloroflexi bacterium]|nr:hypothetical protein [Chloroflexota bacterium]
MLPNDPQETEERKIFKSQYIAVAVAFALFLVTVIVSTLVFDGDIVRMLRVIIPIGFFPVLFVGLSSIKHRVSIMRPKGRRRHSTGKQAVIIGIMLIAVYVINTIIVFMPIFEWFVDSFLSG